jgi:DNA-binding response OmpR family regulator
MTTLTLAQSEILDRLLVHAARRDAIAAERAKRMEAEAKAQKEEAEMSADETNLLIRLRESGSLDYTHIEFDDDRKTLHWNKGSIRFGEKPYKFVKALYEADEQTMDMTDIEHQVWGETSNGNIQVVASRLRAKFEDEIPDFPYTIVNIKCQNSAWEIIDQCNNQTRPVIIRNALTSFKLVKK